MTEHVDVLIVGAGLAGIGAAHRIHSAFPHRTYAILEARDAIGGTWDLFRYPGVRSDSDMETLGYRFRPWPHKESIASGGSIVDYIRQTAADAGINRHCRFGHKVVQASWSTEDSQWTVEAEHNGKPVQLTTSFLYLCTGYYHYDAGHNPDFPGVAQFGGTVVHPQHWPADLDYKDKKVVVIGSGATAITLVPAMAPDAAHVTMLQRSPTYISTMPAVDKLANRLRKLLGDRLAYAITRCKNIAKVALIYRISRRRPDAMKSFLIKTIAKQLPHDYDVGTHFTPHYKPWDQRICMAPDGDLFGAISRGDASVVTDHIREFTPTGIRLESGSTVDADIIVTATGLRLQPLGGMRLVVDGDDVKLPETLAYKGMMLGGVPNLVFTIGYANAAWNLKAGLVSDYAIRLLRHMDAHGYSRCVPADDDTTVAKRPLLDFKAGFVLRSIHEFPRSGSRAPWQLSMSYARDVIDLRFGKLENGTLRFTKV
jgi:monooxygenase